jgi:uncharacterized protein involved in exopolysaccharide biosynthesis
MDRESHRAIREVADQSALTRQDDEILLAEELRDPRGRERTIARLRLLWVHRSFLARVLAIGLIGFCMIAFLIPSSYESTATLMPPDQQTGGLGMLAALAGRAGSGGSDSDMGSGLAGLAGEALGLKTSGDLFVGVLGSRTVQDDIISKFDLREVYSFYPWKDSWESARKTLKARTDVSSDRKSGIIAIKVTDRSPQRAAAMAQEYVAELNHVVTTLNTSSAHRERVFLESRLSGVKQDLELAEKDFSQFASKNTAINIPEQGKAMIAAAAEFQGQLIAAETQLESLKQLYTDNNVRVREAQARVDELRRQLGKIAGQPSGEAATGAGDMEAAYPSIRQLPVLGVSYADLYRRTKVEEAVFETLTQQYEMAKVEEAKETPSVKVLDPADVPERKSGPPRLLISLGGMLLAGAFGVVWVFKMENWRRMDPQDPTKVLVRDVVESIRPYVPSRSSNGSAAKGAGNGFLARITGRRFQKREMGESEDRE